MEALEAFQASQPECEPEVFFWIDVISIDQHSVGGWPQEWWTTTFKQAIGLIGHTVMMLSPWDGPVPLTRAWCLWELHCTVSVGARFSVCLGPDERAALEAALVGDAQCRAVLAVFSGIDVAKSEAGKPADLEMILQAVRATEGGTGGLNAMALAEMRKWVLSVMSAMVLERTDASGALDGSRLDDVYNLATTAYKLEDQELARKLFAAVEEGQVAHCGPLDMEPLRTRMNQAMILKDRGQLHEARRVFEDVIAAQTATLGEMRAMHPYLYVCMHNLANCLSDMGQMDEAHRVYKETLDGQTRLLGPMHISTLMTSSNYGGLLHLTGRHIEARALYEKTLPGYVRMHGPTHVRTLVGKANYAALLSDMGEYAEARPLFDECIEQGETDRGFRGLT